MNGVTPRIDSLNPDYSIFTQPSADVLQRIVDSLVIQDSDNPFLMNMMNHFGFPEWDYSIIDFDQSGQHYIVTIPFFKRDSLTSVLLFLDHVEHQHFQLFSKAIVDSVLTTNITESDEETLFLPISRMLTYEFFHNSKILENYNDWIIDITSLNVIDDRALVFSYGYQYIERDGAGNPVALVGGTRFGVSGCGTAPGGGGHFYYTTREFGETSSGFGGNTSSNDNSVSATTQQILDQLNLEQEEEDCFAQHFGPDAQKVISDLLSDGDIIDPCQPEKTTENLIEEIIRQLCASRTTPEDNGGSFPNPDNDGDFGGDFLNVSVTANEVDNSLSGNDFITDQLKTTCPKASCILEKLLKTPEQSIFCTTLHKIDGWGKIQIRIGAGKLGDDLSGVTTIKKGNKPPIDIIINKTLCESNNPLEIAEPILHESIHAFMKGLAIKTGFEGDLTKIEKVYKHILDNDYGGDHHAFMTEMFLEPMANTLHALNGKRGNPEDYYGLIISGLVYELDENGDRDGFNKILQDWIKDSNINPNNLNVEEFASEMYNTYEANIVNHPDGFGVNFDCSN